MYVESEFGVFAWCTHIVRLTWGPTCPCEDYADRTVCMHQAGCLAYDASRLPILVENVGV